MKNISLSKPTRQIMFKPKLGNVKASFKPNFSKIGGIVGTKATNDSAQYGQRKRIM